MAADYSFALQFPLEWSKPAPSKASAAPVHTAAYEQVLSALGGNLKAKLRSGAELVRERAQGQRSSMPTMVAPLDQLLGGGLPKGQLVELSARRSAGRFSIVLSALAAATSAGEPAALVDLGDQLDPQSAAEAGTELERLLWVRPKTTKEAVMAAEMLITTGFPLVAIDLGVQLRGRRVADASWIRLARAAEGHGAALLVSTPWPVAGTAASVVLSIRHNHGTWTGNGQSPRLLAGIAATMAVEKAPGKRSCSEALELGS